MECTLSSALLSQQLTAISGVIARNPIVPILENFLFEVDRERLVVTASDLQTSISTTLVVQASGEVSVAIPARMLLDTVKNLPEQIIKLVVNPTTYAISIHSDNGHYTLSGERADDFPLLSPVKEGGVSLDIEVDLVKNILQKTLFAIGNDELKPAMTGLYIALTPTMATFVTTDGNRLVRYMRKNLTAAALNPIIIPKKSLMLLNGLLSSKETSLNLSFDTDKVQFDLNKVILTARLIDERYPDYENVIPKEYTSKLTINRPALLSALRRTAIYASKATHQVKLTMEGEVLTIVAEDLDFANTATEKLICTYEGEVLEVGFNAKLLMDMLASIGSEEIECCFWGSNKAVRIFPKGQHPEEDLLLLIMPIIF